MSPSEIRDRIIVCDGNTKIICTENINDALLEANKDHQAGEVTCVCGSFYLVAEARELLIHQSKSIA